MSGCPDLARPRFICPTQDDLAGAAMALLPPGRGWGTHQGPPPRGSVVYRFWYAVAAGAFAWLTARLCALRLEFWCATHVEMHDVWLAEYGLPDACDPFPDLCTKVAAIGGTRCEYYTAIAALAGWDIDCGDATASCGSTAGCGLAGTAKPGKPQIAARIVLTVYLGSSTAYTSGPQTPPLTGRLLAGSPLACPPDTGGLQCLMARIVHAEITIAYNALVGTRTSYASLDYSLSDDSQFLPGLN